MQQTFVKTVSGNQVEFSRLLFPIRYKAYIRIENKNPIIADIEKESGNWCVKSQSENYSFLQELQQGLIDIVEENELKSVTTTS